VLELHDINRSFGSRQVLTEVSFTVAGGRITGFVGGNGAGKTTTMRIILGVLTSDRGSVTLDGVPLQAGDRRRFGYMPEERGLYPKMRTAEQLVYLARLHGFSSAAAERSARDLLEQLGLAERGNDTVESLSLGNQQRAQIAAALVHEPEVLILDEPFSGLDPMAVEVVLAVLRQRSDAGAPVLFSSHQLDIVERLCDDLVIIADGRIRAQGSRDRLRSEHAGHRYEAVFASDAGWLRHVAGVTIIDFDGGYALFDVDDDQTARGVLRQALDHGDVVSFAPRRPSLSDIFKEVIS